MMLLVLAGILSGAAAGWLIRKMCDGAAIRAAVNQIEAHLLEFRLFADEPSVIWSSWRGLLAGNARLLYVLLPPVLILFIAGMPFFFFLDGLYATSPLPVGKPALVTVGFGTPLEALPVTPALRAPEGILVDMPPVRIFSERQVSWRIRPLRELSGTLQWRIGGADVSKTIAAGNAFAWHSAERTQSWIQWIRYPLEGPLPAGPMRWIEIAYPAAEPALFGLALPWAVWFLVFSCCGAGLAHLLGRAPAVVPQNRKPAAY